MAGKNFIQAMGLKKGAFTKQAKSAGMDVQGYASKVLEAGSKASERTKKRARLAKMFKQLAERRKKGE